MASTTLGLIRAALLTAITITNLASIPILILAITFGSGGVFQYVVLGLNIFACLVPIAYWYHRVISLDKHAYIRNIIAFGLLSVVGIASATLNLVRDGEQNGMALVNDFAMLGNSRTVARASIAVAMLSACFSIMGLAVAYLGWAWQKPASNDNTSNDNTNAGPQADRPVVCFVHSSTSKSCDEDKLSDVYSQQESLDKF